MIALSVSRASGWTNGGWKIILIYLIYGYYRGKDGEVIMPSEWSDKDYTTHLKIVTDQEKEYIIQRRRKAGIIPAKSQDGATAEPKNLVGLALSGGGMRSATFNLGVLQAFSELGLLSCVDYLTTVSGGGYIGTCLTSLLSMRELTLTSETQVWDKPSPLQNGAPDKLKANTKVEIIGQDWWHVKCGQQEGWIYGYPGTVLVGDRNHLEMKSGVLLWQNPETQDEILNYLPERTGVTLLGRWCKIRYETPADPDLNRAAGFAVGWIYQGKDLGSTYRFKFKPDFERFPFNPHLNPFHAQGKTDESGHPQQFHQHLPTRNHQIYHMRLKGNFIIPRHGFISRDFLRALGSVLIGLSHMLLIFFILFLGIAAFHYVLTGLLTSPVSLFTPTEAAPAESLASGQVITATDTVAIVELVPSSHATDTLQVPISLDMLPYVIFTPMPLEQLTQPAEDRSLNFNLPVIYWFALAIGIVFASISSQYLYTFYKNRASHRRPRGNQGKALAMKSKAGLMAKVAQFVAWCIRSTQPQKPGLSVQELIDAETLIQFAAGAVALMIVVIAAFKLLLNSESTTQFYWLWTPAAFTLGSWMATTLAYPVFQLRTWNPEFRSIISAWQGLNTYGVLFFLAFAVLALPYYITIGSVADVMQGGGRNLVILVLTPLLSLISSYFLATSSPKNISGTVWAKLLSQFLKLQQFALNTLVVIFVTSLIILFGTLFKQIPIILAGEKIRVAATYAASSLVIFTTALIIIVWFLIGKIVSKKEWGPGWVQIPTILLLLSLSLLMLWLFQGGISLYIPTFWVWFNQSGFWWLLGGLVVLNILIAWYQRLKYWQLQLWLSLILFSFILLFWGGIYLLEIWYWLKLLDIWLIGILVVLILLPLTYLINLNRISLHYFYRDRLTEAFLQTETLTDQGEVKTVRDHSQIKLHDINPDGCSAPYHLIVGTLNLPGSDILTYKDRKSEHFIFSRYYCGSKSTGYLKTDLYRGGLTDLSRAMAISGAAISSSLGYYTFFGQAFVMTMLNLRLGYWMDNPRRYHLADIFGQSWLSKIIRRGSDNPITNESGAFWPRYLWYELAATAADKRKLINLSDGGHTDNLGLYPLLQRRCKLIIVSDVGADPAYVCQDLARIMTQAYVEDNITIKIDLEQLRPDKSTGLSCFHCAIGEIEYPDTDPGWLILLKPLITGDEEGVIKTYWWTHTTDKFPQQSTADQFYDDDQFEVYRRLGQDTVKHTVEALKDHYHELLKEPHAEQQDEEAAHSHVFDELTRAKLVSEIFAHLESKEKLRLHLSRLSKAYEQSKNNNGQDQAPDVDKWDNFEGLIDFLTEKIMPDLKAVAAADKAQRSK